MKYDADKESDFLEKLIPFLQVVVIVSLCCVAVLLGVLVYKVLRDLGGTKPTVRVVSNAAVAPEVCTGNGRVVRVTEQANVYTVRCQSDVLVFVAAK